MSIGTMPNLPRPPKSQSPVRRSVWISISAVVVILVIVVGLFVVGVIHFSQTQGTPGPCNGCGAPPFAIGAPLAGTCPTGDNFTDNGCSAGEYVYTLTIESSVILLDEILFHTSTDSGGSYIATGTSGFSILSLQGVALAQFSGPSGLMSMTSGWSTYSAGSSPSTPLLTTDSLLIDMGTVSPHDQGYLVYANGTGLFAGTTSPLELP